MSSLIVEVCKIDDIYPHKNADKMDIAKIKGWEVCVGKGQFNVGDTVVYFPPDCIIPLELSDKLNITKYLSKGRVKATNLRGFCSYGTIMKYDGDKPVGSCMVEELGITKWEPPVKATDGDAEKPNSALHTYFSMENLRNYPNAILDGEYVIFTEKLHGENTRTGLIQVSNDEGIKVWTWACGSNNVQRKQYITKEDGTKEESKFWKALTKDCKELLAMLSYSGYSAEEIDNNPPVKNEIGNNVVIFSERFGSGCQDLTYGMSNGKFEFRYFDITINGRYLDADDKYRLFHLHGLNSVPVLYRGPFNLDKAIEFANGNTTLGGHIKEGIVICSAFERPCITDKRVFSRTQFKLINPDYLTRKNGTEYH